jgi:hypothetical protein
MRADLLEAHAAVEWAEAQLPVLEARIEVWRKDSPHGIAQKFDPQRGKDAVKIVLRKPLPLLINAETGAIINSIRSSLDLLVTALAERNGHMAPKDTYFPIYKSLARFDDPKDPTHEKIARLSATDVAAIKALNPYPGGNDSLVALHDLDVMRKHRRLVEASLDIQRWGITGFGLNAAFPDTWVRLEDETPNIWIAAGAKDYKLDVTIDVTLRKPLVPTRGRLAPTLHEFARTAYNIIGLFDGP